VVEVGTSLLSELAFYVSTLVLKPIESTEIDQTVVNEFMNAQYRITTMVPLLDHPRKEVRIVDQEGLDELLEVYNEYAEFIVDVTKIDSVSAA
jgi:GTP-binding protein EngB required for normal cell division